jgi:phosphoglucomutase
MVDHIAAAFGAAVFRAEVGEANVVGLARKLRSEGWRVRILGEGSAGGNITHPSSVRDPLATIMACLKLLRIGRRGSREGFFGLWQQKSGKEPASGFPSLSELCAALPAFVSTGVYEKEAVLHVQTDDHALLKERYEAIFKDEWTRRKDEFLSRFGVSRWTAQAYNGLVCKKNIECFREAGRGGLRVSFITGDYNPQTELNTFATLWMRGSATEKAFRIMVDVEGRDRSLERELLFWHRDMVMRADGSETR